MAVPIFRSVVLKTKKRLTWSIWLSGFRIFSIAFFIEADPVGISFSRNSPFGSSGEHIISWRRCFTLKLTNEKSIWLSNHRAGIWNRARWLVNIHHTTEIARKSKSNQTYHVNDLSHMTVGSYDLSLVRWLLCGGCHVVETEHLGLQNLGVSDRKIFFALETKCVLSV